MKRSVQFIVLWYYSMNMMKENYLLLSFQMHDICVHVCSLLFPFINMFNHVNHYIIIYNLTLTVEIRILLYIHNVHVHVSVYHV